MSSSPTIKQDPTFSLESARLNALVAKTKVHQNYSTADKKELASSARGFESMFVTQLYKQMRETFLTKDEDSDEETGSFGEDTLRGLTDPQFGDYVSESQQGFGIAQMMYKQLTGENLPMKYQTSGAEPRVLTKKETDSIDKKSSQSSMEFDTHSSPRVSTVANGKVATTVKQRIENFDETIEKASSKYGVPSKIIKAVIATESAGRVDAKSSVGAVGLMQLMPATAKELGVQTPMNPHQNIDGGTKYLSQLLEKFDGNLEHTLAAYNAGPGNVEKYNGIPPFKETKNYVRRVTSLIDQFESD